MKTSAKRFSKETKNACVFVFQEKCYQYCTYIMDIENVWQRNFTTYSSSTITMDNHILHHIRRISFFNQKAKKNSIVWGSFYSQVDLNISTLSKIKETFFNHEEHNFNFCLTKKKMILLNEKQYRKVMKKLSQQLREELGLVSTSKDE